jgi:hypothetical protein
MREQTQWGIQRERERTRKERQWKKEKRERERERENEQRETRRGATNLGNVALGKEAHSGLAQHLPLLRLAVGLARVVQEAPKVARARRVNVSAKERILSKICRTILKKNTNLHALAVSRVQQHGVVVPHAALLQAPRLLLLVNHVAHVPATRRVNKRENVEKYDLRTPSQTRPCECPAPRARRSPCGPASPAKNQSIRAAESAGFGNWSRRTCRGSTRSALRGSRSASPSNPGP